MISKKKLTALSVATLFGTPVMAASSNHMFVNGNGLQGNSGYITADDTLFQEALDKTSSANVVKLAVWGKIDDPTKNGLVDLTLQKTEGYKLSKIDFSDNSRLETLDHRAKLTLKNTTLELTDGLLFRTASKQYNPGDSPIGQLSSKNDVYLLNSTLKGDIVNRYWSYNENYGHHYDIALKQETNIHLSGNSHWTGNLKENINLGSSMGKPIEQSQVGGSYTVDLKDNSSWTGGIELTANSKTDVAIDNTSSWLANQNATVNNLQVAEGGRVTAQDASVTINNFAGKGDLFLDQNGKVAINSANDKVNAIFTTLEGNKLTTGDAVNADVTIVGALADANTMASLIEKYNANQSYKGQGTVTFEGGLLGDDRIGKSDSNGQFIQHAIRKNARLVSIGESTAITMMQWRAGADDMAQRMGDLRNNHGNVGIWARTFGGKTEASHVDNTYYGIEAGVDTLFSTVGATQFVGGALSYTKGDNSFVNGSGTNNIGALSGYSTWLFDNGAYIDINAKWGKLNNEFDLNYESTKLIGKYSTQAIAVSVESGQRFPLTQHTYIEPQVAFTTSHIFGTDYDTTHGARIEQNAINSYVGRLGVQAGLNYPESKTSAYVRASYLYDFGGEVSTTAHMATTDTNRFDQDLGGGWVELNLGMNVNFTKTLTGYADLEYSSGCDIKSPYTWSAGVRYTF